MIKTKLWRVLLTTVIVAILFVVGRLTVWNLFFPTIYYTDNHLYVAKDTNEDDPFKSIEFKADNIFVTTNEDVIYIPDYQVVTQSDEHYSDDIIFTDATGAEYYIDPVVGSFKKVKEIQVFQENVPIQVLELN
jgi:hypothetical protein